MKNSRVKKSRFDRYIFGALIALELLMSFTFLGYVQIPPVSFTTAYIPILIAGRILGTGEATAVGFVFGAASLYKASASYTLWSDMLFSPLYSTNPVGSVILSVGTRTLFGFLSGLMYKVARKSRPERHMVFACDSFVDRHTCAFGLYRDADIFPDGGGAERQYEHQEERHYNGIYEHIYCRGRGGAL